MKRKVVKKVNRTRSSNNAENEFERRLRVAREKMAGALIEFVEEMRAKPVTRSIMFRLFFLYNSVYEFRKKVKSMRVEADPQEPLRLLQKSKMNFS